LIGCGQNSPAFYELEFSFQACFQFFDISESAQKKAGQCEVCPAFSMYVALYLERGVTSILRVR